MIRKSFIILFLLSVCCVAGLRAQVAMGGWRTHFAYNSVTQIAQTENKVYAVSNGGLFSIDKLDNNVEIYSKITGLNGSVVSAIKYDAVNKQLIIGYDNGNIDLLTNGGIINIPDFYNKIMTVNKSINHINIHNNKAYLSCHFGIIVLNLQRREVAETYYIGDNASEVDVVNTTVHNNEIYALTFTPIGETDESKRTYTLFKANVNDKNLVNYEHWSKVTGLPGTGTSYQNILSFAGNLIIHADWVVYREGKAGWERFMEQDAYTNINASGNRLIAANERGHIYVSDENLNVQYMPNVVQYARAGEYDSSRDTYWFASGDVGVTSYRPTDGQINQIKPDGPYVNTPWDITFAGEKMFVVPGGRWSERYARSGYVMIYENGKWTNILPTDIFPNAPDLVQDFMNVAVDPADDTHFFVTSFGTGLYEFRDNKFARRYLTDVFETAAADNPLHYTRLDGAVFDARGNLFVANSSSIKGAIKILLKSNETWLHRTYTGLNDLPTLGKILINDRNPNQKWVLSVRHDKRGIGIFDDKGTLEDDRDDSSVFMASFIDTDSNSGEKIVPDNFFSIAQDKNGVIWVGTGNGPLLFHNTENAFESGYTCSRVKISRNDGTTQADYLLAEEEIKAIAIDGANRKWIGTSTSGAYLLSENGQETIHHFTTENSPLQSNEILSIAINPVSGEVFFGTGAGLVSYQSDAAQGAKTFENVYAYPNPVRENFNGVITITGLMENTQVKITDLSGNLICETISNGSIATWDGKDAWGRKVNTGIYLAMCISEDGKDSAIAKIMVIN